MDCVRRGGDGFKNASTGWQCLLRIIGRCIRGHEDEIEGKDTYIGSHCAYEMKKQKGQGQFP